MHPTAYSPNELAQLRASARSLEDIELWLIERPEYFFGNAPLPPHARVLLKLHTDNMTILQSHTYKGLRLKYACLADTDFTCPLLQQIGVAQPKTSNVQYSNEGLLLLSLQEWPYATALVTGTYIENLLNGMLAEAMPEVENYVDTHLAIHFPGFSVQRLLDWVAAGVIACFNDKYPSAKSLMSALFLSKNRDPSPELPDAVIR